MHQQPEHQFRDVGSINDHQVQSAKSHPPQPSPEVMVETAKSKAIKNRSCHRRIGGERRHREADVAGGTRGGKKVAQNVRVGVQLLRAQKHFAAHGSVASWCWSSRRAKPVRQNFERRLQKWLVPSPSAVLQSGPRSMTPTVPVPDALPMMPSDLQDLERWLLVADLWDALEFCRFWFRRQTTLTAQGAAKLHARLETKTCCCVQHPEIRVGEASNPGPTRQLRPGHGAPSESPFPTRRNARSQAVAQKGHRNGLVVEIAPNVVATLQLLCQIHHTERVSV